ncbi:polysaccharide deacetylase [Knoellia subterranea KCTC 19937]|uniref:Polysaccharide deacetylase n=1 Tax=Knoellia subterranea KCTC 19937 TaxID=1385521 RepID=A0A0A0JUB6_9MICO|nr:polysaccharide deacetylase [Knoellia subterranea KCTC 19937]
MPHLFYHSLVVDPARAFTGSRQGIGFSQYMVSVSEFTKQLEQIHENGWVLVHPQDLAAPGPDGTMTRKRLMLPAGKKPLVLSIDDVSYYEYMKGKGFASKLVIAPDGRVRNTYVDAAGREQVGAFDVVPIVDDFVRAHPDFSHNGAKGTIALTGYNGILGYRTSAREYGDNATTRKEQASAKAVAAALKGEGWNFASHTWGHINMTSSSLERVKADSGRWDREVRPLVGDTPLLVYPFGADIAGVEKYSTRNAKFSYLHGREEFSYFFNVDASRTHWMQLTSHAMRQARINVDGMTMQRTLSGRTTVLDGFFDTKSTVDPARPLPVPGGAGPVPGGG